MKIPRVKKYCPLCKDQPCEQLADHVFRCILCGYKIDETKDPAYHHPVLISRPSIYSGGKKFFIKDELSRSEQTHMLNKELENSKRYDKDSMFNPNRGLQPGKSTTGKWMSAEYANLALEMNEEDLNKFFKNNRMRK